MPQLKTLKWNHARDCILHDIRNGKYSPGQKLPSEQNLAGELKMNHMTLRRGLEELAKEGLIDKRPGVGNFVKEINPPERLTQIAILLPSWMRDTGQESSLERLRKMEGELADIFMHHPYPSIVLNEISRLLDPNQYTSTILFFRQGMFWQDAAQIVLARSIKGVIIFPSDVKQSDVEKLKNEGISIVLMDRCREWDGLNACTVSIDNSLLISQVLDGLYERGHRQICVVSGDTDGAPVAWQHILDVFCRRTGLRLSEQLQILNYVGDFHLLEKLFEFHPRPTAVIVPDEFVASVVFRVCYRHHLRIPKDISLVAEGNHVPGIHSVPLTAPDSLRVQARAIQLAIQYLLRLLAGEEVIERHIELQPSVQWKASVGPAATRES